MAESKRVSGRQVPSGTSGRAPAPTSTSGRVQTAGTSGRSAAPAGVSPSGRMTSAPSSASGRAPAPAPAPVSRSKMTPATAAAPRASARVTRRDEGKTKVKKQRGVGSSLMVCFGALGVLGLLAGVLFVVKSGEKKKAESSKNTQQEIYEANIKLGFTSYAKAEMSGLLYCMGQEKDNVLSDETKLRDKLFAPFVGDDKIYNVAFEWRHKDKKAKDKTDSQVMFKERTHIEKMEKGELNNEIRVTYGFAEGKTIPLVISSKNIKPTEGDQANLGGTITVVAKAEDDKIFEAARKAKAPPPKGEVSTPPPAPAPDKQADPAK